MMLFASVADFSQVLDGIWNWGVANQATLISIALVLLPTLITATSNHPRAQGLLKLLLELIDRGSLTQHSNSQPRKFFGHFKLPLMRSLPPAGEDHLYPSVIDALRKRICRCPAPSSTPAGAIAQLPKYAVVDFGGTGVPFADIVKYAAAQQRQFNEQFALPPPMAWGAPVQYVRASLPADVKPEERVIGLFEHPDQPGALGYHDTTPTGMPVGHVFPKLSAQDGVPWTVTASHEATELQADPLLNACFQRQSDGAVLAGEVADAVEQDQYNIDGVPLSNWCRPTWFSPPQNTAGVSYDWLNLCKEAYEVRAGGYSQTWDPSSGWTQTTAQKRAYRAAPRTTSRAARRAAKGAPKKAA